MENYLGAMLSSSPSGNVTIYIRKNITLKTEEHTFTRALAYARPMHPFCMHSFIGATGKMNGTSKALTWRMLVTDEVS